AADLITLDGKGVGRRGRAGGVTGCCGRCDAVGGTSRIVGGCGRRCVARCLGGPERRRQPTSYEQKSDDARNLRWTRLFEIFLSPFRGSHAEILFEHGIEEAQMPVAAFESDVDYFGIRVGEQLTRLEQAQLSLLHANRRAEVPA